MIPALFPHGSGGHEHMKKRVPMMCAARAAAFGLFATNLQA
jgi:hypothetical protein